MHWKLVSPALSYMSINIEYTAGKGVSSFEDPHNYKVNVKMKFTMFQAF